MNNRPRPTGNVDEAVLPCDDFDVDVVSDIEEDDADLEAEAEVEEDPDPDLDVTCEVFDSTTPPKSDDSKGSPNSEEEPEVDVESEIIDEEEPELDIECELLDEEEDEVEVTCAIEDNVNTAMNANA